MENLINMLFPPKCVFCGAIGDVFCDNCISNCNILRDQVCLLCDRPSTDGNTHPSCLGDVVSRVSDKSIVQDTIPSQSLSVFVYENNVRECIRKSKYSSRIFMCLKRLAFEGVNILFEWGYDFKDYIVVPIPVSKEKEKLRGFNQADIISKYFSKRFDLQVDKSLLTRIKDKHAQHNLTRKERFENVKGAFVSKKEVSGKRIVLVDDICTTGATFVEASKSLYEAGALDVKCFSLSKKLI